MWFSFPPWVFAHLGDQAGVTGEWEGPWTSLLFMMLFTRPQVPSPFTESCKVEVKAPGAVGTLPTARKDLAWASVWQEDVSDVLEVSP